ncbi:MAG: glycosyltransferase family 8 protein [Alphaproteobacteria bacterium]|nr:glycosyltransferase family 8 protein [Alphaproteobacteria bacterium]
MKKIYALLLIITALTLVWCVYFFMPVRRIIPKPVDTSKETVPVFFPIDNNYAKFMAVSMASILANTNNPVHFYVMHSGLSDENKAKLEQLKKFRDCEIDYIEFDDKKIPFAYHGHAKHISKETMMRLYAADYAPQFDKVIYLDADLIFVSDIGTLYRTDIDEYYMAAVPDRILYFGLLKLPAQVLYANAGVMIFNTKKWRQDNIIETFIKLLREHFTEVLYPDQDVLNIAFAGKTVYLPQSYNTTVNFPYPFYQEEDPTYDDAKVIHWAGPEKPWKYPNVKKQELFWRYAAVTPFYAELRRTYLFNLLPFCYDLLVKKFSNKY